MSKQFAQKIKAGLIVGTLDILAAFSYYFSKTGDKNVLTVLRFVASGMFGKEAFTGGYSMIISGLILHYMIAFSFTIFFFWLFRKTKVFLENNVLIGTIYGIFIWSVMNMIVVPLSRIGLRPFNLSNALINVIILIVCIGIPLSYMANSFYKKEELDEYPEI